MICDTCIHSAVCDKFEGFRNPLYWIDTAGETHCDHYAYEELRDGDICEYPVKENAKNKSKATVQIVRILPHNPEVAEIKFLDVEVDDTGNGFFDYLLKTGGTMNASLKYMKRKVSANGKEEN